MALNSLFVLKLQLNPNQPTNSGKGETIEKDLATKTVMKMCEPYLNAGRTVCTDNYYTSIPLARKLLQSETHLIGTLRANRKYLPSDVTQARLKPGEVQAAENDDGIVVIKWKHKRDVLILSTKHDDTTVDSGKKSRKKEPIIKPKAVIEYNQTKQGTDLSDQMSSYHSLLRKSVRWFHKLAIKVLLGLSIVNAHCLFNKRQSITEQMSITAFRESITTRLPTSVTYLLLVRQQTWSLILFICWGNAASVKVAGDKTDAGDVIV